MQEPSEEKVASTESGEAIVKEQTDSEINHNEQEATGEAVVVLCESSNTRLFQLAAEVEQLKKEQDTFRNNQEL